MAGSGDYGGDVQRLRWSNRAYPVSPVSTPSRVVALLDTSRVKLNEYIGIINVDCWVPCYPLPGGDGISRLLISIHDEAQASVPSTSAGPTNRSKEAERTPMREEVMAKRWFKAHKDSGDQLPSQNSRASGRAADPNSRIPMSAEARGVEVVSSGGDIWASVSAVTNQPGKMDEVPTSKEVLRFKKKRKLERPATFAKLYCRWNGRFQLAGAHVGWCECSRWPNWKLSDGNVKPNLRKWQNSWSAAGQMDSAHLGRPLSPVNVHGRLGPSQIVQKLLASTNLRNPPHTNKAVRVDSQATVGLAVKLERMQVADSVIAMKRPRKPKGAPADDVALAKLRPSHSHSDVGGRDVIMSTEDTHVGSSGSQIAKIPREVTGKAKAGHRKRQNSDAGQMNDTNSKIPISQNVNTPDVDRHRKEKQMRTARLKGAKLNLVPAVVEGGVLLIHKTHHLRKGKEPAAGEPKAKRAKLNTTTPSSTIPTCFFPDVTTSSIDTLQVPSNGGAQSVKTKRKAKEPTTGELLTVMPELTGTKCVNGVSWLCSQNPYILPEEAGKCFGVSAGDGKRILELTRTWDFACATEQLLQEVATTESTSHSQPTLAESTGQVEESLSAISVLDPPSKVSTASNTTKDSLVGAGP
ncbi:hypothetical protein K443DRAFT_124211 [Laccaria amethystina LaAM-08-1]|uniref:Uncharacterized protein n=1 Tax=Laccaria amethystina LaAM-08-1 TaxID=1095629 RepID=A0A0C9X6U0_9AGAR|nr:hypothetical protein K443DRAFT_124211 [Laccaria amethystina LaAM-08-1]